MAPAFKRHTRLFVTILFERSMGTKGNRSQVLRWTNWSDDLTAHHALYLSCEPSAHNCHGFTMTLPHRHNGYISHVEVASNHFKITPDPLTKSTAQTRVSRRNISNIAGSVDTLIPEERICHLFNVAYLFNQLLSKWIFRLATNEASKGAFIVCEYHHCFVL